MFRILVVQTHLYFFSMTNKPWPIKLNSPRLKATHNVGLDYWIGTIKEKSVKLFESSLENTNENQYRYFKNSKLKIMKHYKILLLGRVWEEIKAKNAKVVPF